MVSFEFIIGHGRYLTLRKVTGLANIYHFQWTGLHIFPSPLDIWTEGEFLDFIESMHGVF